MPGLTYTMRTYANGSGEKCALPIGHKGVVEMHIDALEELLKRAGFTESDPIVATLTLHERLDEMGTD